MTITLHGTRLGVVLWGVFLVFCFFDLLTMYMYYKFRYGGKAKFITAMVVLALAILIGNTASEPKGFSEVSIPAGLILLSILLYPLVSMPISMELREEEGLIIKRLLWQSYYDAEKYVFVVMEDMPNMSHALFNISTRGYFGYRGWFWAGRGGIFRLMQTEYTGTYLCVSPYEGKGKFLIACRP